MSTDHAVGREKVTFTSADVGAERRARLRDLFPECASDGRIDFDKLRAALGESVAAGPERFTFSWAGRADAATLLQTPSRATLVPRPAESVNWDATRNLFIEGDNLEVLKLLYKAYAGKVKLIYIDPPYNTGNDFVYPDDFADPLAVYLKLTGQADEAGKLLTSNPETSGRFHSAWLSMMYPRLFLARQLLRDDGVIFVSIDDHEVHHLRLLMNEVFGEENFVAVFIFVNEGNIDNQSKIKQNHEYVVMYGRSAELLSAPSVIDPNVPATSKLHNEFIENTLVKNGPGNPPSRITLPVGFPAQFEEGTINPNPDPNFWPKLGGQAVVKNFQLTKPVTVESGWSAKEIFERFIQNGLKPVFDTKDQETTFYLSQTGVVIVKKRRHESQSHVLTVLRSMGTVQQESARLSELGLTFSFPKPRDLLQYLVKIGATSDSVVMDFFAGSGGIADAVLNLNREDGGNRRFVLVQLPELTGNNKFRTIADIGKERTRRVLRKLNNEPGNLSRTITEDLGFKVFALAASHFEQWAGVPERDPAKFADTMGLFLDPLKPGSDPVAVLWELAIKEGYGLNSTIMPVTVGPNIVYTVTDPEKDPPQSFRACLDATLAPDIARRLGLTAADLFLCRDAALDDTLAANLALQCRLKTL